MQTKLAIGDKVTMKNANGLLFPGKTIVRIDNSDFAKQFGPRYFISPIDTPWFSFKEENLSKEI